METTNYKQNNPRREFLGKLAAGATALSLSSVFLPFQSEANSNFLAAAEGDADEWFNKLKGKTGESRVKSTIFQPSRATASSMDLNFWFLSIFFSREARARWRPVRKAQVAAKMEATETIMEPLAKP